MPAYPTRTVGRLSLRATLALVVLGPSAVPTTAEGASPSVVELIGRLKDKDGAKAALKALVSRGEAAVPSLVKAAHEGGSLILRGWAVVALARIGTPEAAQGLRSIQDASNSSGLLRSWAAAGQIEMARSVEELVALAPAAASYPSVLRPLRLRLEMLLSRSQVSVEQLLELAIRQRQLQSVVAPRVLAAGAKPLVRAMTTSGDDNVRRQAAAFLATLASQDDQAAKVGRTVAKACAFSPQAQAVPWAGGALFVPSIAWRREEARQLVGHLIAWHLWCERNGKKNLQRQIHNNIRSLALARAAGYASPGWNDVGVDRWLQIWGKTVGRTELEGLLRAQGVHNDKRYRAIVDQL